MSYEETSCRDMGLDEKELEYPEALIHSHGLPSDSFEELQSVRLHEADAAMTNADTDGVVRDSLPLSSMRLNREGSKQMSTAIRRLSSFSAHSTLYVSTSFVMTHAYRPCTRS